MKKKLLESFKEKLIYLQGDGDTENQHSQADDVLCRLLIELGYKEIVEEYYRIKKWYA